MKQFGDLLPDYQKTLNERAENKRVTKPYQLAGLEIADLLDDRQHKALFIRLAKEHDNQKLMELAKRIADNKTIANKGAYFMKIFFSKE